MRYVVGLLAAAAGGWMAFDGLRALATGKYTTFGSGRNAGQLGPWADLVQSLGIDPDGLLMIWIFILYGTAWVLSTGFYVTAPQAGWRYQLGFAIGGLWYLFIGTIAAAAIILILAAAPAARGRHEEKPQGQVETTD